MMATNQMETWGLTVDGTAYGGAGSATGQASQPLTALVQQVVHLQRAVESQRAIGVLVGLVAGRWPCTADQAWAAVVRASQHTNVKVSDIARIYTAAHNGQAQDDADGLILARLLEHLPAPRHIQTP